MLIDSSTGSDGIVSESVVATRILFTRVIDGLPVLGPGNKVSVTLSPDHITIVGFDVDWPNLQRSPQILQIADNSVMRKRIQRYWNGSLSRAPGEILSTGWTLDCGYYDRGVAAGKGVHLLDPACVMVTPKGSVRQVAVIP